MTSKSDDVVSWLRDRILDGAIAVGESISASDVTSAYNAAHTSQHNVSRTTAYAALKRLADQGYVRSAGDRGPFIVEQPNATMAEIRALQSCLSAFAVSLIAPGRAAPLVSRLNRMTQSMRLAVVRCAACEDDGSCDEIADAFQTYSAAFHSALVDASSHGALRAAFGYLDRLAPAGPPLDVADMSDRLSAHEALIDALSASDQGQAFSLENAIHGPAAPGECETEPGAVASGRRGG